MEDIKFLNGNKYRLDGCYIELTSRCNLRCKHCYNDSGELKEEISEQAFQNILNCYDRDIEPYSLEENLYYIPKFGISQIWLLNQVLEIF